jgi:transcriptional regulator with XRE-family HTH domain
VSTFKDFREQTGWSVYELAKEAGVSPSTVNRMEHLKDTVTRRMAYKVLNTISTRIGKKVNIEDVERLETIISYKQKEESK